MIKLMNHKYIHAYIRRYKHTLQDQPSIPKRNKKLKKKIDIKKKISRRYQEEKESTPGNKIFPKSKSKNEQTTSVAESDLHLSARPDSTNTCWMLL